MANELEPHAEWQRLYERYHAMSDDELLDLAIGTDDLTEIAANVLDGELKARRLTIVEPLWRDRIPIAAMEAATVQEVAPGQTELMTFYDALNAGRACDFLGENGIDFDLQDVSQPQSAMRSFDNLPPVMLKLIVQKRDRERAKVILREKMGLFPLREVEVEDALVDDGTISELGYFARKEDAEEFGRILDDARTWHRIVPNPEGSVEDENLFALEVREIDLIRAGELVEKAMDLPEA
jgi:hypothetical protein